MATKKQKVTAERISLDVENIRIDANPETVATMMSALIHIPSYRKNFEKNPVAHLKEVGIAVPNDVARQISPASIRATLEELTEGGPERAAILPGVGVAIRVGTRPGTRPGVNVGVRVVTGSSTFAAVRLEEEARPGLAARQRGQKAKRARRTQSSDESTE